MLWSSYVFVSQHLNFTHQENTITIISSLESSRSQGAYENDGLRRVLPTLSKWQQQQQIQKKVSLDKSIGHHVIIHPQVAETRLQEDSLCVSVRTTCQPEKNPQKRVRFSMVFEYKAYEKEPWFMAQNDIRKIYEYHCLAYRLLEVYNRMRPLNQRYPKVKVLMPRHPKIFNRTDLRCWGFSPAPFKSV